LERRWDEALRADEQLRAEYERFTRNCPKQLTPSEREQIEALAQDLPALWEADSTTPQDRQMIERLLLEQVTVTVEGNTDRVEIELRWSGGFSSRQILLRPVQTYEQLSNYKDLAARVESLRDEGKTLTEISQVLNAEGFHPPKRASRFNKGILSRFLREQKARAGPRVRDEQDQQHLRPHEWWLADLAGELSMPIATLHRWQRVGWVRSRKVTASRGRWAIHADADELDRLRRLRDSPRGWPQPYPAELITQNRRPTNTKPRHASNAASASSIKVLSLEAL